MKIIKILTIILIAFILVNVNIADEKRCKDLAEKGLKGIENNIKGYSKIAKPEPQAILPKKLKQYVGDTELDDLGNNFNLRYWGPKKYSIQAYVSNTTFILRPKFYGVLLL